MSDDEQPEVSSFIEDEPISKAKTYTFDQPTDAAQEEGV